MDMEGYLPARLKGSRSLYNVPWMFEARKFLRKKCIDSAPKLVSSGVTSVTIVNSSWIK